MNACSPAGASSGTKRGTTGVGLWPTASTACGSGDGDAGTRPEEPRDRNPSNGVPALVDRDWVLSDSRVSMEYLDERFPHPPLMPVDPVTRAQFRLALFRIEHDWYSLAAEIVGGLERKPTTRAVKALEESILSSVEIFAAKKFFLSDEFSLVDATIAPILWRLPQFGIKLPAQARPIQRYMDDVFSRPSFQASLTDMERELRQ